MNPALVELVNPVRHLDQVGLARDSRQVAQHDDERRIAEDVAQSRRGSVRLVYDEICEHSFSGSALQPRSGDRT